jgi:protein AATF/BFR2
VDTKASKGRKLRYTAHEKIQNFMVPIPRATWHEEQIDELFASLLGGAEKQDGTDGVRPNGDSASADASLADGFKLFG